MEIPVVLNIWTEKHEIPCNKVVQLIFCNSNNKIELGDKLK